MMMRYSQITELPIFGFNITDKDKNIDPVRVDMSASFGGSFTMNPDTVGTEYHNHLDHFLHVS